ncbi:hypothetical protein GOBAR_DD18919 [Gossypium barbadense]|nr:hypothetical protein GOBAR_DD18919 [Gossypium barbadense]
MLQERHGDGPPHGVILAVVVFIVVLAPFLYGDQGEAITEAISELLTPLVAPPSALPSFFSSSCSCFTIVFPSSAVAMIPMIDDLTSQPCFCYVFIRFSIVEDWIPMTVSSVAGD